MAPVNEQDENLQQFPVIRKPFNLHCVTVDAIIFGQYSGRPELRPTNADNSGSDFKTVI